MGRLLSGSCAAASEHAETDDAEEHGSSRACLRHSLHGYAVQKCERRWALRATLRKEGQSFRCIGSCEVERLVHPAAESVRRKVVGSGSLALLAEGYNPLVCSWAVEELLLGSGPIEVDSVGLTDRQVVDRLPDRRLLKIAILRDECATRWASGQTVCTAVARTPQPQAAVLTVRAAVVGRSAARGAGLRVEQERISARNVPTGCACVVAQLSVSTVALEASTFAVAA